MNELAASTAPNVINADLPCVHCGYNLKTMSASGRCPECGKDVSDSSAPFDPWWVDGLDRGAASTQTALKVTVGGAIGAVLLALVGFVGLAAGLLILAALAAYFLWVDGTANMTRPPPRWPAFGLFSAPKLAYLCSVLVFVESWVLVVAIGYDRIRSYATVYIMAGTIPVTMMSVAALLARHLCILTRNFENRNGARLAGCVTTLAIAGAVVTAGCGSLYFCCEWFSLPYRPWVSLRNILLWAALLLGVCLYFGVYLMLHGFRRTLKYVLRLRGAVTAPCTDVT